MKRDDLAHSFLLALTAGGFGAAMSLLLNTGFKSEDVFAFSGAIVGAAATVGGAAWLSDRSATRDRRVESAAVEAELVDLIEQAEAALAVEPGQGQWTSLWEARIFALGDIATGVGSFLDEVLDHAKMLDFHQREAVKATRVRIKRFMSFYHDAMDDESELDPRDERTWATMINPMLTEARGAAGALRRIR